MVAKKGGTKGGDGPKKPTASAEPPVTAGWAPPQSATPPISASVPQARAADVKPPAGRAVAIGRDGKPMWRQNAPGDSDPYAGANKYAPPGWTYEWKRYSIYNAPQATYQSTIQRVGRWTPVQHEAHPGVFGAPGERGSIIHEGLILMERPTALHNEARQEEQNLADEKVRRAKRERGLAPASAGIATDTDAARAATYVQESRALQDEHYLEDLAMAKPSYDRSVNSID